MRALTASEIIQLWETAYRFHPIDRALSILQMVMPEHDRGELAALPLGQRDALLLALRQAKFGDALPGKSHCPQCAEAVEFELSCTTLTTGMTEPQHKHLSWDDYSVTVRPLNSFDLAAAAGASTLQQARDLLLQRSVLDVHYQGETITVNKLPDELENCINDEVLAADPQAEMVIDLNCPACQHQWQNVLDIGHILWLEISAQAQRLLLEIHLLAKAYGWNEAEILSLSPTRRASYLQMVAA